MIEVQDISGGYANKEVLQNVSFHVKEGEFFGVIGPNGSGKTTLLNLINGILTPTSGEVVLNGKELPSYSPKEFARWVAVLPQHMTQTFRYTVKETVALGRYAHQKGLFQTFSEQDERIVQKIMQKTGIASYQESLLDELSGGERQRVFLAQALAQQPKILLLDEPTNHLDLAYQKELLDLLKQWTETKELTVLSIFHDLNLASIYCDRLLLLHQGQTSICGHPDEVLHPEQVQLVYQTKVEKLSHPRVPKPQMMLVPETGEKLEGNALIDESLLQLHEQMIQLHAPFSLKTMSSGVIGSGTGWHRVFVNRHVSKDYACVHSDVEMADFLKKNELPVNETVAMMTAVQTTDVSYRFLSTSSCSVFVVVTAGTGNAVNAVLGKQHGSQPKPRPGTINTWVFVNGTLSDTAFIQCLITASEAKVKALADEGVMDEVTGTIATGTSTDSTLIAGTQQGPELSYGGSITPLGGLVGEGVYTCTKEALDRSKERQT